MLVPPALAHRAFPALFLVRAILASTYCTCARGRAEGVGYRPSGRPAQLGRADAFRCLRTLSSWRYTVSMFTPAEKPTPKLTVRDVFPTLPEDQVADVEARLARYVALVYRIYEHVREDPRRYAAFQRRLTETSSSETMESSGDHDSSA